MKSFVPILTFQVVGGREPSCINWMQESESHPPFFVPPNLSGFNWDLDTDCFAAILRYLDPSKCFLLDLPGSICTVNIQCPTGVFSVITFDI